MQSRKWVPSDNPTLTATRAGAVPPIDEGAAPVSFLVDYDGTISLLDVGDALMTRHYPDAAELARQDALYDAGLIGSRELMKWDMDVLPHDPDLLRREAAEMAQDESFPEFVTAARSRGALVEIVSDGFGFYIASNLAAIGVHDVTIVTNENRVGDGSEGMSFPYGHPECFVCGTCKRERVRLHQQSDRVVVFVGDGTSDRYAAAHADVLFAKGSLARFCSEVGWPFVEWESFADITVTVDRAFEEGQLPAATHSLPAWRAQFGRAPRGFICGPEVWGPGRTVPVPPAD